MVNKKIRSDRRSEWEVNKQSEVGDPAKNINLRITLRDAFYIIEQVKVYHLFFNRAKNYLFLLKKTWLCQKIMIVLIKSK